MRNKLLAVVGLVCASDLYAADVGVGVNMNGDSRAIYVPIDISKAFRVEPYFYNYKSYGRDYDYTSTALGVGLFGVTEVAEKTNFLWGARAAYVKGQVLGDDEKGFNLGPVLAIEYFPIKNISLGGEVSYTYSQSKFDDNSHQDKDYKTHGTNTALTLKYYFK